MSAYAMPGLFPPLSYPSSKPSTATDYNDIGGSIDREEKIEYEPTLHISIKDARMDTTRLVESMSRISGRKSARRNNCKQSQLECSPQEDAMQFELSIAFNGRQYTAVRTLPTIFKLWQDLVEEQPETIPQVPRLPQEESNSTLGRGFSFLRAMVQSYTPTLECWLRQISRFDSQSLTHFLWEPLSTAQQIEKPVPGRRSSSAQALDAIEETETEFEEECE